MIGFSIRYSDAYEHWRLSVPYPFRRSYSTFPASVTFKSWFSIFEGKDKWAAHANEVVLLCILADL